MQLRTGLVAAVAVAVSVSLGAALAQAREATAAPPVRADGGGYAAAAPAAPVVSATAEKFAIQSADGANSIRLRGLLDVDGRHFSDSNTVATADTWLLRRVRPIIEGTFDRIFDFRFTPDFGGGKTVVQDAYLVGRFRPWAAVTVGKFKSPVGLERLQSAANLRFIERGLPSDLLPNRDLGLQVGGSAAAGAITYALGYFNGVTDGGSSDRDGDVASDSRGDWDARLFLRPFLRSELPALRGLGFGVGGTYVKSSGNTATTLLPAYRTAGQQSFFSYRGNSSLGNAVYADGQRLRWSPQLYYSAGSVGVLGEYARVSQAVTRVSGGTQRSALLDNSAWQVQLSWLVTGERETFQGVTPHAPFQAGSPGWGAFELVARYGELSIDPAAFAGGADSFADPEQSARRARAAGIGINWYLNRNVRWMLDYEVTRFAGGAADGRDRPDERALLTRFELSF